MVVIRNLSPPSLCRTRVTSDTSSFALPGGGSIGPNLYVDLPNSVLWFTYTAADGNSLVVASTPFPPGLWASSFTDLHTVTMSSFDKTTKGLAINGAGDLWWAIYDSITLVSTIYHLTAGGGFSTLWTGAFTDVASGLVYLAADNALYTQIRNSGVDSLLRIPVNGSTPTTVIADLSLGLGYYTTFQSIFVVGADVFLELRDPATILGAYVVVKWNGATATHTTDDLNTICLEVGDGLLNISHSPNEVKIDPTTLGISSVPCNDYANNFFLAYTPEHDRTYILAANDAFTGAGWWVVT